MLFLEELMRWGWDCSFWDGLAVGVVMVFSSKFGTAVSNQNGNSVNTTERCFSQVSMFDSAQTHDCRCPLNNFMCVSEAVCSYEVPKK